MVVSRSHLHLHFRRRRGGRETSPAVLSTVIISIGCPKEKEREIRNIMYIREAVFCWLRIRHWQAATAGELSVAPLSFSSRCHCKIVAANKQETDWKKNWNSFIMEGMYLHVHVCLCACNTFVVCTVHFNNWPDPSWQIIFQSGNNMSLFLRSVLFKIHAGRWRIQPKQLPVHR